MIIASCVVFWLPRARALWARSKNRLPGKRSQQWSKTERWTGWTKTWCIKLRRNKLCHETIPTPILFSKTYSSICRSQRVCLLSSTSHLIIDSWRSAFEIKNVTISIRNETQILWENPSQTRQCSRQNHSNETSCWTLRLQCHRDKDDLKHSDTVIVSQWTHVHSDKWAAA